MNSNPNTTLNSAERNS